MLVGRIPVGSTRTSPVVLLDVVVVVDLSVLAPAARCDIAGRPAVYPIDSGTRAGTGTEQPTPPAPDRGSHPGARSGRTAIG